MYKRQGYSTGLAESLGGDSQARTRLDFLVEVGNQAYINSGVPARLRLVHAMAVDYSDTATSNNLALDQLTGVDSIRKVLVPPDPAFAALRAARDTYGADLVQLVRKFQTPEQKSCGVAWLNGGGGTTIDPQNEFYGYSVIADGTDRDEGDGKNYFCRNETSVHEFGHNMGSAHDRATGGTTGAYPYSNGYKTDAANGNFYTVMAYGDSGQTAYRIFSNPASTYCGGFACGVAEQSDNCLLYTSPSPRD